MAGRASQAARLRKHREEFSLAVEHGLTLAQARERLRSYREHLPRLAGAPRVSRAEPRSLPWWQRD